MYNGSSPISSVVCTLAVLAGCFLLFFGAPESAFAQDLPASVQRELQERGFTADEARREAVRLGIDLSNPEVAVRRAREIGISESLVRQMILAVRAEEEAAQQQLQLGGSREIDRDVPRMFGPAVLSRDVLVVPLIDPLFFAPNTSEETIEELQEERKRRLASDTVVVRIPLRDELSGIRSVEIFLINDATADTLYAYEVRRVLGSKYEGSWQGLFAVPHDVAIGDWGVYVLAIDESQNDNIIETGTVLRITHDPAEARVERDSMAVADSLPYFGYDLFAVRPESFQPATSGPVDDGYLVGPGDELRLIIFGATEFQQDLVVDDEGRIFVPNVGQRTVAGTRLAELREDLRLWLSRSYAGLTTEPPEVMMDLSVTRLRPVSVFVLGEVPRPGRFPLPSSSTVFNALYAVGGPRYTGSLRNVQVVRRGEVAYQVDLYEYLLKGFSVGDVRLQSSDNIFIPPRGLTVALDGEVHRPAYYELLEGESILDLLDFAGGLKPEAYTRRFQVERVVPFAERVDPMEIRRVLDFSLVGVLSGTENVILENGDRVTIFSIPEATNMAARSRVRAVSVGGAVHNPGRYELSGAIRTVRDLIAEADGLTGDAFLDKVELIRLTSSLQPEVVSLRLEDVIADEPTQNLVLRPQDSLHVFALSELRVRPIVKISGKVRAPGTYEMLENMTVTDLLFRGGGLTDPEHLKTVFQARADIFRKSADGRSEQIVPFDLSEALAGGPVATMPLQPDDEIRIYPLEVEVSRDRYVQIAGAVKAEGQYRFRDGMSLEDLILQAGGFRDDAYFQEVEVTRLDKLRQNGELAMGLEVPLLPPDALNETYSFGVSDSLKAFSEARKFKLQHLDRVYVRTNPAYKPQQTVMVAGEVRFPGEYTLLRENETLSEIIRRAGGVLPTGYPKGGRLYRENLQVIARLDRALGGYRDADIVLLPGDRVLIPAQPNTVAVRGNVAIEGLIKYEPGRRVKYYLSRAGGLRPESEAVLMTQASGATFRVRRGLFKSNPVVDEGAQIFVTKKPPREPGDRIDIGRTIVDTVGIVSSTLTIIVLARQAFRN